MCQFEHAWIGKCKNEGEPYCEEHAKEKCISCGAQATHSCAETGQFVCGCPLCDDCTHLTFPDGTNGGIGFNASPLPNGYSNRHVKKSENKNLPWYMKEANEQQS